MSADRFDELFADLAAQEAGREVHDRAGDYSDLVSEAYADRSLTARLAGAVGTCIDVRTAVGTVRGAVKTVGRTWCLLTDPATGLRILVGTSHITRVRLTGRAHAPAAGASALSMGAPLRRWVAERVGARIELADGNAAEGEFDAIGSDYVQLRSGRSFDLIPFSAAVIIAELR